MQKPSPVKKIIAGIGVSARVTGSSAFYISYQILHPKRKEQKKVPSNFGLPYKKIEFKSKDGTLLKGWLIKARNPKGLIVVSHGYSFDKQSMLPAAKELYKNNYSSLLFDFRAHGESEGHKTTIGFLETQDVLAAVEVAGKFKNKIGLFGVSMGAAASIMASPWIKGLKALVSDSSFAELSTIIYKKSPLLKGLIIKFMDMQGASVEKSKPIDCIAKANCPVLLIHGGKDSLVDPEDSLKLYKKARQPKQLWIVKNGEHGRSYFENKKVYSEKVVEFLDKCFVDS